MLRSLSQALVQSEYFPRSQFIHPHQNIVATHTGILYIHFLSTKYKHSCVICHDFSGFVLYIWAYHIVWDRKYVYHIIEVGSFYIFWIEHFAPRIWKIYNQNFSNKIFIENWEFHTFWLGTVEFYCLHATE